MKQQKEPRMLCESEQTSRPVSLDLCPPAFEVFFSFLFRFGLSQLALFLSLANY
jgi:hypothetical protein